MPMINASPGVSFARDIMPLFTPSEIRSMAEKGVHLDQYRWMSQPSHAQNIYCHLTGKCQPQMPLDGPYWIPETLAIFQQWMTEGYQP